MKTLTSTQQAAVLYHENDLAVLAGAGSGKTLVIAEKVALLTQRLHIAPEKILVVTFTEKAAEEVKARIGEGPFVSTLHGFAAETLRRSGSSLGLGENFRILNEFLTNLEKARSVREMVLEKIGQEDPEVLQAVGRFGFPRTLELFRDLLREPPHRREVVPFPQVFAAISDHYRARKATLSALDFDDLEERLLTLLRATPATFSEKFSWIIVDEFQDTSPLQWEVLSALKAASSSRLMIVGDPRQSIYRFRGAEPSLFGSVSRLIREKGGRVFELAENFRSTRGVVTFVNAASEPLFPHDYPPMTAVRNDVEGIVERIALPESSLNEFRSAESHAVAGRLKALRGEGHLWRSMAILFKTRKAIPFYEAAFKAEGIPYRTSLGEPLLERREVLALIFWMGRKAGTSEAQLRFLETGLFHSPLKGFTEDFPADPLASYLDRLFEATEARFPQEVHIHLKAFRSLLNDLMGLGVAHLKALVQSLQALREEKARISSPESNGGSEDAVTMMTIHGAKGLEWPIVALADLKAGPIRPPNLYLSSEDGDLILKDSAADASGLKERLVKNEIFLQIEKKEREEGLEESKRLLYVALTRARDRLLLPIPTPPTTAKKDKAPREGRWSDWLTL